MVQSIVSNNFLETENPKGGNHLETELDPNVQTTMETNQVKVISVVLSSDSSSPERE